MDLKVTEFSDHTSDFQAISTDFNGSPPTVSVVSDGRLFSASMGCIPEANSSSLSDDRESLDPILKYISDLLMEDDMEGKPWEDSLVLQETEQTLYEVLREQHPSPKSQPLPLNQNVESPVNNVSGCRSGYASNTHSSTRPNGGSGMESKDNRCIGNVGEHNISPIQVPLPSDSNTKQQSSQISLNSKSILQFRRGYEEASKFLPSCEFPTNKKERVSDMIGKHEKKESQQSFDGLRGGRSNKREEIDSVEARSTKQSAVYVEEDDLVKMFDKVLLCKDTCPYDEDGHHHEVSEGLGEPKSGKTPSKRRSQKKEIGDLRTLLVLCANAISSNDVRTASELLKQIREDSSPSGDGSQRLAHYLANALEIRMKGSESRIQNFFSFLTVKKPGSAESLKAYKAQLTACPFKRLAVAYADQMIYKISSKAKALHIVDFGILYGFRWPIFIQHLAMRCGGPPKLRITGIELPLSGFRPAERVEETGRHLARYCEWFNVPFQYNSIVVQDWETIQLEDLKLDRSEVLAVNHIFRFKNLLDETAETDCPRDIVLELIRKMNPDIFVHSIVNANFSAPFFVNRFQEALNHYSAIFDMFDTTLPREEPGRLFLENDLFGNEILNAVAYEGIERLERPETFKKWQVRLVKAGFRQLQLNHDLLDIFRVKVKSKYHKDFLLCEDSHWMCQGWKGRILHASSCWVPA